jgi:signal transduction histidine kinase
VRKGPWVAVGCAVATGVFVVVTAYLVHWTGTGIWDALTTLLPVPIAFACGLLEQRRYIGLAACVWMAATVEVTQSFNPFVLVITLGPWLAGAIILDRQQVAHRLADVGREIEAESERLSDEAVKLERARVARELHDVVAHCVSVMVVQAYAGERLASADEGSATEAFDYIADAAGQAQREITHLVKLLDLAPDGVPGRDLSPALQELVSRAAATGLDVRLHVTGRPNHVPGPAAAVAYRVVQEGVTNAIKHSPGAPIVINVECSSDVRVDVFNTTSGVPASFLGSSGGGHGLSGIRQRVTELGGTFDAGPQPTGAWRMSVRFPAA